VASSTSFDSTEPLSQFTDMLEAAAFKAKARSSRGQEKQGQRHQILSLGMRSFP